MRTIGAIIIGDEILSGRRTDAHFPALVRLLGSKGSTLSWTVIAGDNHDQLVTLFRQTLASGAIVFCFGGIGATPDDLTRECAAEAVNQPLIRLPEAVRVIEAHFGPEAYPYRMEMANLPATARIIPNPVSHIPGFSIEDHHFLPGFPEMALPMADWVLNTHYAPLFPADQPAFAEIRVLNAREGKLVHLMKQILHDFPEVRLSSLPHFDRQGSYVDLGLSGQTAEVRQARDQLLAMVIRLGYDVAKNSASPAE